MAIEIREDPAPGPRAELTATRPPAPELRTETEPSSEAYKLQQVTVRCPTTHLPLATSLYLNAVAFGTSIFTNVRVQCPHCGAEHRWSSADAFLEEFTGTMPPVGMVGRFSAYSRMKKPSPDLPA
jgi:hypothetical protein